MSRPIGSLPLPAGGISISQAAYTQLSLREWVVAVDLHRSLRSDSVVIIERDADDHSVESEIIVKTSHRTSNGVRFVVSTELAVPITTIEMERV